jgi:D-lactate dehydrogenase
MFPSVGAMRAIGTTVIIEDVAFPVPRLAEATIALQRLLAEHGYDDAIIFGHALEGNLHFVFTQDFNVEAEVARYRGFMDALARMVVEGYDGSLKAEHGTGRNIAPFVELEWGADAYRIMREVKRLFDPHGLLNPGVLINDDRDVHLKNLKPLPRMRSARRQMHRVRVLRAEVPVAQADAVAAPENRRLARDRPSRARRRRCGGARDDAHALRIPRHRHLRRVRAVRDRVPGRHRERACSRRRCAAGVRAGRAAACRLRRRAFRRRHARVRAGLAFGRRAQRMLVPIECARRSTVRAASGGRCPSGRRRCRARADTLLRGAVPPQRTLVYFPSCATRTMGAQRGDDEDDALPQSPSGCSPRPAYRRLPERLDELCCGQPFESKGLFDAADRKSAELESALRAPPTAVASDRVRHESLRVPDEALTSPAGSPCRTASSSSTTRAAARRVVPLDDAVAIHPVCSVRKMGIVDKLATIAARCSPESSRSMLSNAAGSPATRGSRVPN